jgi:UDP-N-acetylglucosamine transferase subunit ALG13
MNGVASPINPRILVAPLDWGLGHATRCIPVIRQLIKKNCDVLLAGDGMIQKLLVVEFPSIPFFNLKGYGIVYGTTKWDVFGKMMLQIPRIINAIDDENQWLDDLLAKEKIDAVISDNRYGLYHDDVYSVFITHQLLIKTGLGATADSILQKMNYQYINEYDECWVPDIEGNFTLAGALSHPEKSPEIPVKFIGALSRFCKKENIKEQKHLLILLSGPEPQRTILEEILLEELKDFTGVVLFIRGLPGIAIIPEVKNTITIINHLPAQELQSVINEADYVISRCGYSTVMDLMVMQKKCILIPTPGQTEQEYLSSHLMDKNMALCIPQSKFKLKNALDLATSFNYSFPDLDTSLLLHAAIDGLIKKLQ